VTKPFKTLAFVCVAALASTAAGQAQEKAPAAAPRAATPINATPLKVQVVIGRYQGEKKISSLPYTLTMNANNHASLRMGTSVPVVMLSSSPDPATPKGVAPPAPIQYRDIGTNIDCASTALDEGRYLLSMTVDDSSVYPDEPPSGAKNGPSFRSFRAINAMILKNGETGQFTTATDKMTGETVKIDVTLTVMK
jgi:type II secretory pathway component GspD/PulD (secretin)